MSNINHPHVADEFDKTFASRRWANDTRKAFLHFVYKMVDHYSAAFGGCTDCYGKGYATVREVASGHDEYTGQEYNEQLPLIRFCKCDRGMQLKIYFGKKLS
jgi:hypothetical protein